jgi:hypothetical protein
MKLSKKLMSLLLLCVSMVALGGDIESQHDLDNHLVVAVFYPNAEEVAKRITQGANVNAVVDYLPISYCAPGGARTNILNWTPLMFAANALGIGKSPKNHDKALSIAKILIDSGARVNRPNSISYCDKK